MENNKICKTCKIEKPITEYKTYKNKFYPGKIYTHQHCEKCQVDNRLKYYKLNIEKVRKYYKINKEKIKKCYKLNREKNIKISKDFYKINRNSILEKAKIRRKLNPSEQLLLNIRDIAKKRNLEFTLQQNDLIIPNECPILGITLQVNTNRYNDNSYSFIRINTNLGYLPGNVQIVSFRARRILNKVKKILNSVNRDEIEKVYLYLKELKNVN